MARKTCLEALTEVAAAFASAPASFGLLEPLSERLAATCDELNAKDLARLDGGSI